MSRKKLRIRAHAVIKAGPDGRLDESCLIKERRHKKVGALPVKARMVLQASSRCLEGVSLDGDRRRLGVSLGTSYGSTDVAEQCLRTVHGAGFGGVAPSWYATGLANATSAIVASIHDMRGPNLTLLGHHAGIEAVIFACSQILAGRASAMLAGGFDAPSDYYLSRLRDTPPYAGVTVHGGVGLVWLDAQEGPPAAGTTAVVGWSQGTMDEDAFAAGDFSDLFRSGCNAVPWLAPSQVHALRPARPGAVDYLAATSLIYLIENVIENGAPGLHAVVAKGFGPSVACLLLEKSG